MAAPLPLETQTLYAELLEHFIGVDAHRSMGRLGGSFVEKSIKGDTYLYWQASQPGGKTKQFYFGRRAPALERMVRGYQRSKAERHRSVSGFGSRYGPVVVALFLALSCSSEKTCTLQVDEQCVTFVIVDSSTNQLICDAIIDGGYRGTGACQAGPNGGDATTETCSYSVIVTDGHNGFSVSHVGYLTQTITVPEDECFHLAGSGPKKVSLVRS